MGARHTNIVKLVLYARSKQKSGCFQRDMDACWQKEVKKLMAWDGSLEGVPGWGGTLLDHFAVRLGDPSISPSPFLNPFLFANPPISSQLQFPRGPASPPGLM